jgi:hypothetical protein
MPEKNSGCTVHRYDGCIPLELHQWLSVAISTSFALRGTGSSPKQLSISDVIDVIYGKKRTSNDGYF